MTEVVGRLDPDKLLEALPCGVLLVDAEGLIGTANAAAHRIFGYAPGELIGRPVEVLIPSEQREAHRTSRANFAAQGRPRRMGRGRVLQGERKDGSTVALEVALTPPSAPGEPTIAAVIDLTLLHANADGVAVVDGQGTVLFANAAADALLGDRGGDRRFPFPPLRGETLVVEVLQEGGERRWIEAHMAGVPWDGQDAILASLRDVTERRRIEEERHADRRTALVGRLASGIAHEFNNSLQAILSGAEAARGSQGEDLRGILRSIETAAERSAQLTRRLMEFGGLRLPGARRLALDDTMRELLPVLNDLVGPDIDVRWRPRATGLVLRLEEGQLDQLMLDLVANARDAIDGVGTVDIRAHEVSAGPSPCGCAAGATLDGVHAWLRVADTGSGIDPAILGRVFDPFFTTRPGAHASGLGLAACRAIANRTGSHLCIESEPGRGTTVHFLLPVPFEPLDVTTSGEHVVPPGARILVVDDEQIIRGLVARHLERSGFVVAQAACGADALAVLADEEPFQLLVTDVVMDGMDGFELAGEATRLQPGLPVLFISGYAGSARLGERDVDLLRKPFGMRELVRRVHRALAEAFEHGNAQAD